MVARNLQKLSLLSDGVRWNNFCKYRATMKLLLLSYKKWTLVVHPLNRVTLKNRL